MNHGQLKRQKKRNKVYSPRYSNIPMMAETRNSLALEMYLAIETLITVPSIESYNQLSKMLAALRTAGVTDNCIDRASDAMLTICDRYEANGKIKVLEIEAEILRQSSGDIDRHIGKIPMNKFRESVAEVSAFCISVGA